jgi:hypothetical protein
MLRLIVSELIIICNRVESVICDTWKTLRNKIKLITTAGAHSSVYRLTSSQANLKRHISPFTKWFLSPFIDLHLCTILYILDHILITAPTRFGVHRHIFREHGFTVSSLKLTESSKFRLHQLMHKWIVIKSISKFTLKLTLKQVRHVLMSILM